MFDLTFCNRVLCDKNWESSLCDRGQTRTKLNRPARVKTPTVLARVNSFMLTTFIVTWSRRVKIARLVSLICMPRQQTLGTCALCSSMPLRLRVFHHTQARFITMPPGKKAPPQQASLTEMWGSKRKRQDAPTTTTAATAHASDGHPAFGSAGTNDAAADAGPTTSSDRAS